MLFSYLRVALIVVIAIVFVTQPDWLMDEGKWVLLVAYAATNVVLAVSQRLYWGWQIRRAIRRLRSLDPLRSQQMLRNLLRTPVRQFYAERLRAEGQVASDGVVEQYPFSQQDRRDNVVLFWATAAALALTLLAAATPFGRGPVRGVVLWVIVSLLVVAMVWLRRAERRLASVIAISPFSIVEIDANGNRRSLAWGGPLQLRKNRWRGRLELRPSGSKDFIALHYSRLGFERLVDRVLDYGGFRDPAQSPLEFLPLPAPTNAPQASAAGPASDVGHRRPVAAPGAAFAWRVLPWRAVAVLIVLVAAGAPKMFPLLVDRFSRAPRTLDRPSVESARISPGAWVYGSTTYGTGSAEEGGIWGYSVIPCWHNTVASWCVIVGGDSTMLDRATLEPIRSESGSGDSRVATEYRTDTVLTDYFLSVSDGAETVPRQARAMRRKGAWPEAFVSEIVAAIARPERQTVLPLQPLRDETQDVERDFPGEDARIRGLLRADTAVMWSEGRDSGFITLNRHAGPSPVRLPFRATIITVHYPDRVVTLWVADSTSVILRREQRFRVGPIHLVDVDSLVDMAPLRVLR